MFDYVTFNSSENHFKMIIAKKEITGKIIFSETTRIYLRSRNFEFALFTSLAFLLRKFSAPCSIGLYLPKFNSVKGVIGWRNFCFIIHNFLSFVFMITRDYKGAALHLHHHRRHISKQLEAEECCADLFQLLPIILYIFGSANAWFDHWIEYVLMKL